MTNFYLGLARGPIDHNASSVINVIANEAITMGSGVVLESTIPSSELLPRVNESTTSVIETLYGIAVGGDTDGIYGDGSAATSDLNRATASAGQGIVIVTQGRCPARVQGTDDVGDAAISPGDPLSSSDVIGTLRLASVAADRVVARALQPVEGGATDIIAIDFQREGAFS